MGSRGPLPRPLDKLIAAGSRHAKGRTADHATPLAEPGRVPAKPGWMTEKAQKFWDEVIVALLPLGVLAAVDDQTIGRYCQTYVDWYDVSKTLRDAKYVDTDRFGVEKPHSLCVHQVQLAKQLAILEAALGLSPNARLRLHIKPVAPAKPVAAKPGAPIDGSRFFGSK